jgi:dTDP-4-dehydrorhamnose 3,5-epimerase
MRVIDTDLPEVKIIEPRVVGDSRGFFLETWNAHAFAELGLGATFVQDNHSRSARGVLRGLHYQVEQAQGKLTRVMSGRVFDVAVDLRRSSPRFGRWTGVELSSQNMRLLWVPPGFAHGFLVLEDATDFLYKCTDYYAPEHERTLLWNDPDVGIAWPLGDIGEPQLSAKDVLGARLGDAEVYP